MPDEIKLIKRIDKQPSNFIVGLLKWVSSMQVRKIDHYLRNLTNYKKYFALSSTI